ncbi:MULTISPECIES: ATP-binding protein [unclassified Duganella]|uniref:ATP-binding protein n=1 Tax=unclassified Duganella TaxID=2636909 RepID=UPI0006FF1BA2|nr:MULTISPECIES: ATP-binding protein [unclassified Duganella]KQV42888.1 ATP-binding protein [Duganella sp. Root336D2]KRB97013.1 ATP-binding protein [Duganella sp. Root198D2]
MNDQFRMARLQVFNWGTFSGLHDIPISERGFLIVGPSGAGKSTLLDAFSALLVPPRWIDFNAAAREADRTGRDRNLVSYIRGAWSAQSDSASGVTSTRYLRGGTTTWSAIALHYHNSNGQDVVLLQLFWLRGNSNANTDVKRIFLVLERPFDLRELQDFGSTNFDIRKLKQTLPDAHIKDEFRPYCERFCRLLGIESEMTLRLLHKTQSAKNVGDLNTFLRDFMLDKPETFEVADRLVNEFGELNAAHQSVVTARRQVQTLAPARARHQEMESLQLERNGLKELEAGLNGYREQMRMKLLAGHIEALRIDVEGMSGRVQQLRNSQDNRELALRDLELQRSAAGGDRIEQLEIERRLVEEQRIGRMAKRKQAVDACTALEWTFAGSPDGFALLAGQARRELEEWQQSATGEDQLLELGRARDDVKRKREEVLQELQSLRRQPSSIPAHMLEMRRQLAAALGLGHDALPFAGELMEVKPEEAQWRGAIERVLHGFALSILVDEEHYAALANHVNEASLGQKLVYFRTGRAEQSQARALRASSLVTKLNVKSGRFADWLQADLRQRFDYECVESMRAFRAAPERALTREGQVKHNRARHEKDDRNSVNDRRYWVLGFDNREKLSLYEQQDQELRQQHESLEIQLSALGKQRREAGARVLQCHTLANLQWHEIEVEPLVLRIGAIERQLAAIRDGNANLQAIDDRLRQQRELVKQAAAALEEEKVSLLARQREIDLHEKQLAAAQQDPSIVRPTPYQQQGLDERYLRLPQPLVLKDVDHADRVVRKGISDDILKLSEHIGDCGKFIEAQFSAFISNWRADSDGLDAALAAAPDFFTKLTRLETDGLPAHEQRFFDLLRNQSHQNLAALNTYLSDARKAILARMEVVNESLRQVPFNRNEERTTYLQIQPKDRQLPDVRQFKQDILDALSHAWHDDPEAAEARFIELRRLVDRLSSQDAEQRRWRESVLDVRLHVEFIGREYDEHGVEQDVLESGAGKSGGQRQKLATTVLAAALRYQLGGSESGVPVYAPVVLDEAFDKADNEFTALAMNIFANFGFQMIVATPLKSVMTLEPFIGGACFVAIRDRRESGILLIEYDEEQRRLKLASDVRAEASLEAAG